MNRKNILVCILLQIIILILSGIAYLIFDIRVALSVFAVTECVAILVNGIVAYNRYRYSRRFREKQSLELASTNMSATDLREWVEFSNNFNLAEPEQIQKNDTFSEEDPLDKAQKQWQKERRTERGEAQYNRILSNWKTYVTVCLHDKKVTESKRCQLEIIRFMLKDNASIKQKDTIIQFCNLIGRNREIAMEAIDQLLIQRAIIIAMEGSLEYYRLNLGWNILLDIEKAKKILIMQEEEEEQMKSAGDGKNIPSETTLDSTTIERVEEQVIAQSVTRYRNEIKEQVIRCMEAEPNAISTVDLLANHSELGTVNQLSLEEIMKELVQQGQAIRIEDTYPVTYRLTKRRS